MISAKRQWGSVLERLRKRPATACIEGNDIGTDSIGKAALGNEIHGVILSNNASGNSIGGASADQGNTIAYNVGSGVLVQSGTGNSILSNSIFSNGHLGIDLAAPGDPANGVTPNGTGVRVGPNDLQNHPVLTAVVGGTKGSAQATLNSLPNTSFLIQFFSNTAPDPSGYGEGQTLLGSQAVTTDVNGNATVSLTPPKGLSSNAWVSATATNEVTGDTSEFSLDLVAQPVSVQFSMNVFAVESSAGVAMIDVERVGNISALVSVQYATSNGTAIAGKQYVATSGTLTFLPGQSYSLQTFPVTILPNQGQSGGTTTVNLALSQPAEGATLGAISSAILSIGAVPAPPPPPADLVSPSLISEQLVSNGQAITAIVLGFSKPIVPGRAQNLGNYGYFVYSPGTNGVFGAAGGGYIGLSAAVYTPSTESVTITPSVPLPLDTFWRITIDGQTSTLLNNGLTDASNNLLIGSDGNVGSPFVVTFAAGKRLAYTDGARNVVSLHLTKGGLMEMFRTPSGDAQQLQLVGTIARKTTLSGSVSRARGGTGRTFLPPIAGAAGARIQLKNPPFVFRRTTLLSDAEVDRASAVAARRPAAMADRPFSRLRRHH